MSPIVAAASARRMSKERRFIKPVRASVVARSSAKRSLERRSPLQPGSARRQHEPSRREASRRGLRQIIDGARAHSFHNVRLIQVASRNQKDRNGGRGRIRRRRATTSKPLIPGIAASRTMASTRSGAATAVSTATSPELEPRIGTLPAVSQWTMSLRRSDRRRRRVQSRSRDQDDPPAP